MTEHNVIYLDDVEMMKKLIKFERRKFIDYLIVITGSQNCIQDHKSSNGIINMFNTSKETAKVMLLIELSKERKRKRVHFNIVHIKELTVILKII